MKKVILYSLLLVTFLSVTGFTRLQDEPKKGANKTKGFYYAYCYFMEGNKRRIQFSSIFHINSEDKMEEVNAVMEKYKSENGYNGNGLKGPFVNHDDALDSKTQEKITWRNKRFLVNGDNNFMGSSF
jgi:hypothetical protein